ncbi:hypothetical protein JCM21900_004947 [Sporobolomyces salmonicolor]
MASAWDLWLTPTISLSLIVEAESPVPSVARFLSQWVLYFRPALLKQALEYELEQRPHQDIVSGAALRVVDYAYWREMTANGGDLYRPVRRDALSLSIAMSEGVECPSAEYELLEVSLQRVLVSYSIVDKVVEVSKQPFPKDKSADRQLRELWGLLKPEKEFGGLIGKHWQDLGFQNTSPSTDLRGVGMLGLESLLYFARTYGERAAEIVDEAVNGGSKWYPLALASLHMTAFALDLATSRDLQLFLLRSLQTRPSVPTSPPANLTSSSSTSSSDTPIDITPFLRIASDLLLLFHEHWKQGGFTVMQFEQISKDFQAALRPWIRRGVLDGRALGWEKWDEGAIKLE